MTYPTKTLRMDFGDNLDHSKLGRRTKHVDPNHLRCSYIDLNPRISSLGVLLEMAGIGLQLIR